MNRYSLQIPIDVLTLFHHHALSESPNECCGFLAGSLEDDIGIVHDYIPLVNELARPDRFLTEARSVLQAERRMRAAGLHLLSVCHSHPSSPPVPSQTDLAENSYGETIPWFIIGLANPEPECQLWWLSENHFEPGIWRTSHPGKACS